MNTFEICILGGGPASLLLCYLLKKRGISAISIGPNKYGALTPSSINNKPINVLPIFPVKEEVFCKKLFPSSLTSLPTLKIERPKPKFIKNNRLPKGSFAENAYSNHGSLSLSIGEKLFGGRIFSEELSLVIDKVNRHYGFDNPLITRAGYVDGLSPYYRFLNGNLDLSFYEAELESISLHKKIVNYYSDKHGSLSYKYLVSTIDIDTLCQLIGSNNEFDLEYEGSMFQSYISDKDIGANRLVYNTDPQSPIIRIFTPCEGHVVVQISKHCQKFNNIEIEDGVRQAFKSSLKLELVSIDSFKKCYPIHIGNKESFKRLNSMMHQNDAFLFGRHGSFQYKDLHELDWNIVDHLADKTQDINLSNFGNFKHAC